MSKRNNSTPMFLNLGFLFSVLLMFAIAESRSISGGLRGIPACDKVVAVNVGNTCSGVALSNSLTTEFFAALNPNLECSALFIGQWLCVEGTLI